MQSPSPYSESSTRTRPKTDHQLVKEGPSFQTMLMERNPTPYGNDQVESPFDFLRNGLPSEASRLHSPLARVQSPAADDEGGGKEGGGEEKRNPYRKFSKQWFSRSWDSAVEAGRWPRLIYMVLALILIALWIGLIIYFAQFEVKQQLENQNLGSPGGTSDVGIAVPDTLVLQGQLKSFDPVARNLQVSWSFMTIDQDKNIIPLGNSRNSTVHLGLFRDVRAVREERKLPPRFAQANSPAMGFEGMRIDNITEIPIAVLGAHPWDSVNADIDMGQAVPDYAWNQPLFGYPFERWTGNVVFATAVMGAEADNGTYADLANITGFRNSFVFSIDDAVIVDDILNWRIRTERNNTCVDPPGGGNKTSCEMQIEFKGSRTPLVVFVVMLAVVVNWVTTIGIFILTAEIVVMRRTYIASGVDVLAACLTALFALPSIRSILPGAPDFGAIIDLIGIIPNIIIISLCTTAIAVIKLRTPRPDRRYRYWKDM